MRLKFSSALALFLFLFLTGSSQSVSRPSADTAKSPLNLIPHINFFYRTGDAPEVPIEVTNNTSDEVTGQIQLELINSKTNQSVDGWFINTFPNQYFTTTSKKTESIAFPFQIPFQSPDTINWKAWVRVDTAGNKFSMTGSKAGTIVVLKALNEDSLKKFLVKDNNVVIQKVEWVIKEGPVTNSTYLNSYKELAFHIVFELKKATENLTIEIPLAANMGIVERGPKGLSLIRNNKSKIEAYKKQKAQKYDLHFRMVVVEAGTYSTGSGTVYVNGKPVYLIPSQTIRVSNSN